MPAKRNSIRVAELFAGVGGFRVGLERASKGRKHVFETVWSNQWEPGAKVQHASKIYQDRFKDKGGAHSNEDIAEEVKKGKIPDHDLLVGGFPCQDYSVARTLSQAKGLEGKKGVLWWEIYNIVKQKIDKKKPIKYLFLENVDRLLKSPANQRGRDFAIMLACLAELGYAVEWRIINAADYGMPQRRRRIFILGYYKNTKLYKRLKANVKKGAYDWMQKEGVLAKAFPVTDGKYGNEVRGEELSSDIKFISDSFNKKEGAISPFENAGCMIDGRFYTTHVKPVYKGKKKVLGDIIFDETKVPEEFYIDKKDIKKWKALKGAKSEDRKSKSGFVYKYSEGSMPFPDPLDRPSRTIVTGEGGSTPSRFKHVIEQGGKLRRLIPEELEKLCGFDPGHTAGIQPARRAFLMGNALVVGIIETIGAQLLNEIATL